MVSEEEAVSGHETTPEFVSQPSFSSKKSKRLTLQERLAAAAKAKRKKNKKNEQLKGNVSETDPEITANYKDKDASSLNNVQNGATEENNESIEKMPAEVRVNSESVSDVKPETENLGGKGDEASTYDDKSLNNRVAEPETEIEASLMAEKLLTSAKCEKCSDGYIIDAKEAEINGLKQQLETLYHKLDEKEKQFRQQTRWAPPSQDSDKKLAEKDKLIAQAEKKINEKESTIVQLMQEGQGLSKKELKLNERIKTLMTNNTKLESSLKSYAEKNEELLLSLGEIEDLVKVHKLQSVSQLFDVIASSNQKIVDLQATIEKELNNNWEGKYKEVQRLFEKELDEKKECRTQLNEVSVQLELFTNQSRLELQSKTDIIEQLNREIMSSKDESSIEVLRLEAKIESLRTENENVLKSSKGSAGSSENNDSVPKKMVDYVDFSKLSEAHQNLQAQYVSSQENWKLIESNLQNRIEALADSVEYARKAKVKSTAEVKKLHSKLSVQLDEIEKLKSELALVADQKTEHEFRLQMKVNECTELEENIEELRTVFNSDRDNYDVKIKNLTESVQDLQAQRPTFTPSVSFDHLSSAQGRKSVRDNGLHISMETPRQSLNRKFSTNSILSSSMNTPAQNWENFSYQSEGPDGIYDGNNNVSTFSFNEEIYPLEVPEPGDMSMGINSGISNSGTTKHIHLINKMSATIRRLEADVAIFREENDHLAAEKEATQQEIIRRLAVDDKLEVLESRIELLHAKLAEKSREEETLLEVIGEKSERVSELEADVDDLKDLLRSQVQQMIEMHNSKGNEKN